MAVKREEDDHQRLTCVENRRKAVQRLREYKLVIET